MKSCFSWAAMLAMVLLAWGAQGATPVKRKAAVRKGASKSASASSSKRGKKAPARHATTWRNRQLAPTPDRYREIQQALAGKGYLKPEEATGSWNASSVDALKRFQSAQNLDASGKINSLSLIALGLGPKREPVGAAPPARPVPETDHAGH